MGRSPTDQHLSRECFDTCRLKLTAVLARLTTGSPNVHVRVAGPGAEARACESTVELALFCRINLAANRMDWTSFLIRLVSEALGRMDQGTYGFCLGCGQPISARRLMALPWVELCTGCQEAKTGVGNT